MSKAQTSQGQGANARLRDGNRAASEYLEAERTTIEADDQYHHYSGNRIPWYVRMIWLGFWAIAIYYTIQFMFPAIRTELFPQ